jgi:hypothetical protein
MILDRIWSGWISYTQKYASDGIHCLETLKCRLRPKSTPG